MVLYIFGRKISVKKQSLAIMGRFLHWLQVRKTVLTCSFLVIKLVVSLFGEGSLKSCILARLRKTTYFQT